MAVHAPIAKRIWQAFDPAMVAVQYYQDEKPRDPWGHDWAKHQNAVFDGWTWSVGPNGINENAWGDDVILDAGTAGQPPENRVFLASPELLIIAALSLFSLWLIYFPFLFPYLKKQQAE